MTHPALDPATVSELRDALGQSLVAGVPGDDLGNALRRVASEARARGVQPEQLLILLKDTWYTLPGLSDRTGAEAQSRLLQQTVARCIEEYYRG